jgi:hypothetical protein
MEVLTINPEKVNDKYRIEVEQWQLMEIKSALERMNKTRAYANKWVEKNRDPNDTPIKKYRTQKPRLAIGDVIEKQQQQQQQQQVTLPIISQEEIKAFMVSQEEMLKTNENSTNNSD